MSKIFYSDGCLSFYYVEEQNVVYRNLRFLGYPNYRIGDDGSVWSRRVKGSGSKGKKSRIGPWWKMKPGGDWKGVMLFACNGDAKGKMWQVHILVLTAFSGNRPSGTLYNGWSEARHLDGNRENNQAVNLQWGTRKQNAADRAKHGVTQKGKPGLKGSKHPRSKLTEEVVRLMRRLYKPRGKWNYITLGKRFGVGAGAVESAVTGNTWKHVI